MDFDELKRQYKKEIDELNKRMEHYTGEFEKLTLLYRKAIQFFQGDRPVLEKIRDLHKLLEEYDFKDMNEVEENYVRIANISERDISRLEELEKIIKSDYKICPECLGLKYKDEIIWVDMDERKEKVVVGKTVIHQPRACILCRARGRIPKKELLDC